MNSQSEMTIETYLTRLRGRLRKLSAEDREEIVREISAHIRECSGEVGGDVERVLQRLGPPEVLASQYSQDELIQRAGRSFSPWLILRATLTLAKRGVEGLALFIGVVFGYVLGGGLIVTAVLKPILPQYVGLWVGPRNLNLGLIVPHPQGPQVHEVLGGSYIPLAFCLGAVFLWVTTYGVRRFLQRSKRRGPIFPINSVAVGLGVGPAVLWSLLFVIGLSGAATQTFCVVNRGDRAVSFRCPKLRSELRIFRDAHGGLHARVGNPETL